MTGITADKSAISTRIHPGDYAAWYKHINGDWIYDVKRGDIISRRTGKPVSFRLSEDGYLTANARLKGVKVSIRKHRAIWVAAHGYLAIPLDYDLEIDHINHDKTDCRIANLRLVTHLENLRASRNAFTKDQIRTIRKKAQEENMTYKELGKIYGVSPKAISKIVRKITYREVTDDE